MQNYFTLLNLPPTFALDAKALEAAYFSAQRATHPDRFVGRSENERVDAMLKSQAVNEAYDCLKNPLTRAEHLLELQGIFVNVDGGEAASPALLMEMMELRERLDDAAATSSPHRGEVGRGADSDSALCGSPHPNPPPMGEGISAILSETKKQASDCQAALTALFAAQDYTTAGQETMRLSYLMKALEQAHMLIYRLKAGAR